MIVSLDMSRMNKIKWMDRPSNLVCVETGINGKDFEKQLNALGVISGHEPVSNLEILYNK